MPKQVNFSNGAVKTVSLFVHRDFMARPSQCWRLLWAESAEADTFTHAEGECSAKHFRTMRDAIAYGERQYGETAQRFIDPREPARSYPKYGDKTDYPKIVLFVKGQYRCVTTWARTCTIAKQEFCKRNPDIDPSDVSASFDKPFR